MYSSVIFHYVGLDSILTQHSRISLLLKITTTLTFTIIPSIKKKITSCRVGEDIDKTGLLPKIHKEQQNNKKKQTPQ